VTNPKKEDDDMTEGKMREAMPFPFRWFATLRMLDDAESRMMFDAIGAYAERGEEPAFTGALAALWNEFKQRIDRDNEHYEAVCERNRRNGRLGGRPKKSGGVSENPEKPKKADAEADPDANPDAEDISKKVSLDTFSPDQRKNVAPGRRSAEEKIRFDYEGDAKIHGVTPEQLAVWEENFPALDVPQELRKATVWLDANRKQRKRDVKRFLASWLARAQDRAKSPPEAPPGILTEGRRNWSATERGL
jgi:hypothetical protein